MEAARLTSLPRLRALDFAPFEAELAAFDAARADAVMAILRGATIPQVQAAMEAGRLTSAELTLFFLDRIRRHDETLRSYAELNPAALAEARAADAARAAGRRGPLLGIPLSIKDNIETDAPLHTTGGAEILLQHVAAADAPVVTRLRRAGAVILGKASLSELAGALTAHAGSSAVAGQGRNPHGSAYPVLGSSSGSAIATAAYLAMASIGTETSGSLLAPAHVNGVVAMKPSHGTVDGDGIIPLIRFQDTAGPVARSVTDAAILLAAIGEAPSARSSLRPDALDGVVAGVLAADIAAATRDDPGLLLRIRDGLEAAGARMVEVGSLDQPDLTPLVMLGLAVDTVGYLAAAGTPVRTLADLRVYNAALPERRIPRGQDFVDLAARYVPLLLQSAGAATPAAVGPAYQELALGLRSRAAATLDAAFAGSGATVLASLGNAHSQLYATAGYPAITVPLGLGADGRPSGLTLIGRRGADVELLAFAYAFEQATGWRVDPVLPR